MSLLEVRNVAKRYGPVVALKSAELVVEPAEIHALLGANGAGKSTLVKILTGVIRHDSGTIAVNGEDVRIASPEGARRVGSHPSSRTRRCWPTSRSPRTCASPAPMSAPPASGSSAWSSPSTLRR
jgi:ABC-type branched-subunit amino acid transport system ATPase component